MVEQIGRQLDMLKDKDSDAAAAVIRVIRQQMDSYEQVGHPSLLCVVCASRVRMRFRARVRVT